MADPEKLLAIVMAGLMCAPEDRPKARIIAATVRPNTAETKTRPRMAGRDKREAMMTEAHPTKTRVNVPTISERSSFRRPTEVSVERPRALVKIIVRVIGASLRKSNNSSARSSGFE